MTNQNLIPPKFTLENKEFIGVTYREPRWGIMGKSVGDPKVAIIEGTQLGRWLPDGFLDTCSSSQACFL